MKQRIDKLTAMMLTVILLMSMFPTAFAETEGFEIEEAEESMPAVVEMASLSSSGKVEFDHSISNTHTNDSSLKISWSSTSGNTEYYSVAVKELDGAPKFPTKDEDQTESGTIIGSYNGTFQTKDTITLKKSKLPDPGKWIKVYVKGFASDRTTVTDEGAYVYFLIEEASSEDESAELSRSKYTAEASGAKNIKVEVTANIDWSLDCSTNDWITLSTDSGSGKGTFYFTVAPNTRAVSRSATIELMDKGRYYVYDTLKITQEASDEEAYLTVSPTTITDDGNGGTYTIALSSNVNWTSSVGSSGKGWITINEENGVGDASITVTVSKNSTGSERTGKILIDSNDDEITNDVIVTQSAVKEDLEEPFVGKVTVTNSNNLHIGDSFSISGKVEGCDYDIDRVSVSLLKDGGAHGVILKTVNVNANSYDLSKITGLTIPASYTCTACGNTETFAQDEDLKLMVYAYSEEYGKTVNNDRSFTLVPKETAEDTRTQYSNPTVSGFTVTLSTVEEGESFSITGTVNGNGCTINAVSVAVRNISDETLGGYWGQKSNLSASNYDLSNMGTLTAGDTIGNTTLSAGTYKVQIYVTTAEGLSFENEYKTTITVTEAEVEDTRAPYINPITSSAGTPIQVGTETTISTKASDDVGLAYIEMFIDGTSVKRIENEGGPEESIRIEYTTSSLTVGDHVVVVKAQDVNGKSSEDVSMTITVIEETVQDTRAPYINPITSSAGTSFEFGTEVTFSTKASDDVGLAYIEMFIDGTSVKKIENEGGPEESIRIEYTTSSLTIGDHVVIVKAQDVNGKSSEDVSMTITVIEETVQDTRAPYINPITSSAGTSFEFGTEVTFSTKASDDVGLAYIEMFVDGKSVQIVDEEGGSEVSVPISYATDELSVGNHTIVVKAKDVNDKMSDEVSLTVTVTEAEIVPATITTLNVSDADINADSVTVSGRIDFGTDETASSYDYVGIQYGVYQSEWAATIGATLNADGSFAAVVKKLNPGTTYAFRAVARKATSQEWITDNNSVIVTTLFDTQVAPITETLDVNVTTITTEGAILRGKVTNDGYVTVTKWGFSWREVGSIDWSSYRFDGTLAENMVAEYALTDLKADTEYEYYFYAENSVGESNHDNQIKNFRTAAKGNTAPSMTAHMKVPAESVEANEDVYFIFNVENCNRVQLVADGQYGFIIDLTTGAEKVGEGKYEWKYAFNKPGENRQIQFVPYNGEVAGAVTKAIILDVTAHLNVSCGLVINPSKWGGDGEVIHVDCNVEWTATTDFPSWITLSADVENDTLNHTYTRNSGYKTREGTITLSAPGCASVVIKVVQDAAPAELVFKAGMNGNSQLQLSVHSGALNPEDSYTMKVYDQSGNLMGTATRTLGSGFSSKSWGIGNPTSGGGLQLPRAVTYTVKVFDSAGKAQQFIDSNGNKRDYQNVTIPLWNGDMIKWIKSGSTEVQNGGTLTWGQDINVHWDGSYGVKKTLITMTVGSKTISITEPSHGELTTTFVANGGYMSEIPESMRPASGKSVDVTITVSVSQNGLSRTSTWKGQFANAAAEASEWYTAYYKFNSDDTKIPAMNDVITVNRSVNKNVIIYAGDNHPSITGSPYYYKFSNAAVLSAKTNKSYNIEVVGVGSCTVEIWNEQTNKMVASVIVQVVDSTSTKAISVKAAWTDFPDKVYKSVDVANNGSITVQSLGNSSSLTITAYDASVSLKPELGKPHRPQKGEMYWLINDPQKNTNFDGWTLEIFGGDRTITVSLYEYDENLSEKLIYQFSIVVQKDDILKERYKLCIVSVKNGTIFDSYDNVAGLTADIAIYHWYNSEEQMFATHPEVKFGVLDTYTNEVYTSNTADGIYLNAKTFVDFNVCYVGEREKESIGYYIKMDAGTFMQKLYGLNEGVRTIQLYANGVLVDELSIKVVVAPSSTPDRPSIGEMVETGANLLMAQKLMAAMVFADIGLDTVVGEFDLGRTVKLLQAKDEFKDQTTEDYWKHVLVDGLGMEEKEADVMYPLFSVVLRWIKGGNLEAKTVTEPISYSEITNNVIDNTLSLVETTIDLTADAHSSMSDSGQIKYLLIGSAIYKFSGNPDAGEQIMIQALTDGDVIEEGATIYTIDEERLYRDLYKDALEDDEDAEFEIGSVFYINKDKDSNESVPCYRKITDEAGDGSYSIDEIDLD